MKPKIESLVDGLISESVLSQLVDLYQDMDKEGVDSVGDAVIGHIYSSALSQVALMGLNEDRLDESRKMLSEIFIVRLLEIKHKLRLIINR